MNEYLNCKALQKLYTWTSRIHFIVCRSDLALNNFSTFSFQNSFPSQLARLIATATAKDQNIGVSEVSRGNQNEKLNKGKTRFG